LGATTGIAPVTVRQLHLSIACVFCFSGMAFAQGAVGQSDDAAVGAVQGWYVAPEVLGYFPEKSGLTDTAMVGGRVGYQVCPDFALELEVGWLESDLKGVDGDVSMIPMLFNARYDFLGGQGPWGLFVMGGLGWSWNEADVENVDVSLDTSFVGQAGGGLEYRFTNAISVVAEVRYFWSDAEVEFGQADVDDLNLNGLMAGGSLVFHF
jgi:opacity protein-like surface antigen